MTILTLCKFIPGRGFVSEILSHDTGCKRVIVGHGSGTRAGGAAEGRSVTEDGISGVGRCASSRVAVQ